MSQPRALLLTDVVDSTRVAQALGDPVMARHWAAHDRAARDLLPPWRGREIDKTDGVLLLFDCAGDAAGYALAYHRALAALGDAQIASVLSYVRRSWEHGAATITPERVATEVARRLAAK